MSKKLQAVTAIMLAVLLLTTALPFSVSAEDAIKNDAPTSGTTGDCTWSLDIYSYTLTITFPAFGENRDVHEPIILNLHAGDTYRVAVPPVDGYKALVKEVTGTMPPRDTEVAVTMLGEDVTVEIPDNPTPLGVSNAALGSGEIIE